jgi:zona occludens toxin
MAILFFEGLPRAGKSYEAMATQIIPFLQKGREVVAYVEGLNHERIAEAAGMAVERVRELLFVLTREDMRPREEKKGGKLVQVDGAWIEKTRDNALHVFDEAQNWWPNRLRPTEQLTQFVTEHGHRGITVLLMGQSLLDVLALWRRRVDQKFGFLKLTALGTDKRYRVTVYKGRGNDEFEKVTDKLCKYDPKYFGTYASHVADDTITETYTDKRARFLNADFVRYGVPVVLGLAIWGGSKAWSFFHPAQPEQAKPGSVSVSKAIPPAASPVAVAAGPAKPAAEAPPLPDKRSAEERYFAELGNKGRVRLSGLLVGRGHVAGVVEWVDGNTRVIERIGLDTMRELGVTVVVVGPAVKLNLGEWSQLATMWPVEAEGRVSEYRQATIRPVDDRAEAGSAPGPMVIDNGRTAVAAPVNKVGADVPPSPRVQAGSKWSFQTGG